MSLLFNERNRIEFFFLKNKDPKKIHIASDPAQICELFRFYFTFKAHSGAYVGQFWPGLKVYGSGIKTFHYLNLGRTLLILNCSPFSISTTCLTSWQKFMYCHTSPSVKDVLLFFFTFLTLYWQLLLLVASLSTMANFELHCSQSIFFTSTVRSRVAGRCVCSLYSTVI